MGFDYDAAFSRNIGWVTEAEQQLLRSKRIAIAGLGGVGGSHLLTLARLGIGAFNIADFDLFDIPNFNRQAGAFMSTVNKPKIDTLATVALDINPTISLKKFPAGISDENLTQFLDGVDLYVDSLDYFALDIRQKVFAACASRGIPALTAAPLGMGVAFLNFLPGSMTFEEYFCLDGQPPNEQAVRFLLGLSPAMLQMGYLVDKSRVNLAERRGPSTVMACQLCAGLAAAEALKILLKRGKVIAAPYGLHFDAYRNKLVKTWRPYGNRNPIQRLGLAIARRRLADIAANSGNVPQKKLGVVEQILDLARWAPSGDNTQVWRFEIIANDHVVVHGFDTREHCVYDIDGHPSHLALGALLENIAIAASNNKLRCEVAPRTEANNQKRAFDVRFIADAAINTDPLASCIRTRSVQRRPLQTLPLTQDQKAALEAALGKEYEIAWFEGGKIRWQVARLLFHNAKLRLTIPEAYEVHRSVIQWNSRFSEDKVPDQAVGLDPIGTWLMRWVMQSWKRVDFFNKYLFGTWLPRIQLDLLPGLFCAAHFLIVARSKPQDVNDYISAGRAMQRFWLTATRLGLQLQPEMTPLIFASYVRQRRTFTVVKGAMQEAEQLASQLTDLVGERASTNAVFMGRIGTGSPATARSLRLPLDQLLTKPTN